MDARDHITVKVDDDAPEAMAWADFAAANDDLAAEVAAVLDAGDEYVGGGGAAPLFRVSKH